MNLEKCPLCGIEYNSESNVKMHHADDEPCTHSFNPQDGEFMEHYCGYFDVHFWISESIVFMNDDETREKLFDLIMEHLLRAKYWTENGGKCKWHFYYNDIYEGPQRRSPECVNLASALKSYPDQVMDKAHRSLMNLSLRYPHYGNYVLSDWRAIRVCFEHEENHTGPSGMLDILVDLGYLKKTAHSRQITAAGWQKIEELRKNEQVVRQAFIAMIFREEANPIREAFRRAIEEMNYHAVILDEKEHNNQIVPEIFYEIKRSKFVVVDVTFPSYGAYYEAGYAQALGKEVIVCCREDVFNDPEKKPHFDIAQQAIITWKDEEELVRKLKRRIEATVT